MNARVVSATEFKAKCLALLDEGGAGGHNHHHQAPPARCRSGANTEEGLEVPQRRLVPESPDRRRHCQRWHVRSMGRGSRENETR